MEHFLRGLVLGISITFWLGLFFGEYNFKNKH